MAASKKSPKGVSVKALSSLTGYHLRIASNAVQSHLAGILAPFNLRMITFSALVVIDENPGLRQSQLAEALSIERPNLVSVVNELVDREWVVRAASQQDRRAQALSLSTKGEALLQQAQAAVWAHERQVFARLDDKAQRQLKAMLQLISMQGVSK